MPGTYVLVDHSIFRAFNKGALGMLKVEGAENKAVYSGKEVDDVYLGDKAASRAAGRRAAAGGSRRHPHAGGSRLRRAARCSRAHARFATRTTAQGLPDVFPPLAKSDYLMATGSARSASCSTA